MLRLDGKVSVHGEETAAISEFIQQLQKDPVISAITEDIVLHNMDKLNMDELEIYQFTVLCVLKKEIDAEFYYLKADQK